MALIPLVGLAFDPNPTALPRTVAATFTLKSAGSASVKITTRYSVAGNAPIGFGPGGVRTTWTTADDEVMPIDTTITHSLAIEWRTPDHSDCSVRIDADIEDSGNGSLNLVEYLVVRGDGAPSLAVESPRKLRGKG